MKRATKQELDVGLQAAHQAIEELRQRIFYARNPHEAEKLQERLDLVIEELDMIEREQIRRLCAGEVVYC